MQLPVRDMSLANVRQMIKEAVDDSPFEVTDNNSIGYPLLSFDLPCLIVKMKHSRSWAKGQLKNMILLDTPDRQVLLTALHEKTEIDSSQENDSVAFHILEGEMVFTTLKKSLILKEGQMLTLSGRLPYRLSTNEETVFLLTIYRCPVKPDQGFLAEHEQF